MRAMGGDKSSYSWWLGSHISPNQSQWLQATLTDLDEKTKAMLALIQEDGDSFAQRAEMYYKKRPELIKMVEEFHRSYRSLAERYDQLRSESTRVTQSGSSSSSNSFKHLHSISKRSVGSIGDSKRETPDSHPESIVEDPDVECCSSKYDSAHLNKLADEHIPIEQSKSIPNTNLKVNVGNNRREGKCAEVFDTEDYNKKINGFELGQNMDGEFAMGSFEETTWSDLRSQVSMLMEDNLRQQAELIRRNDEKRETIKDLCFQLDKLMDENKTLQNCLRCSKLGMKQNSSQILKLKGLILGKLLGGGSQRC